MHQAANVNTEVSMKKGLLLLTSLILIGCATGPEPETLDIKTQEGRDCVKECRFRHSLCTSACERKRDRRHVRRYPDELGFGDGRRRCMNECRRKLQDCCRRCLEAEERSSD